MAARHSIKEYALSTSYIHVLFILYKCQFLNLFLFCAKNQDIECFKSIKVEEWIRHPKLWRQTKSKISTKYGQSILKFISKYKIGSL